NASFFNEWAESTKIYTYYSFTAPNVEQLSEQIQQLKSNIPSIYAQDPIFAKLEITDWNTDTVDTITNMIETMVENKYHENQIMYVFNELNVEKYPQGTHFALHLFIGKTAILPPRATHVTELISELNMGSNILAKNCFVILYDLDDATQINIAKQKKIEKYPVIALTDKQRKTLPDEATAVIITDNPEQVCQTFQMLWRQMAIIEFQFYYFSKLLYKEKIYTHYYFTASSVEQLCEQIQQQILSKTPISADNSIFFKLETNESIETLDPIVEIMNLNDLDVHWEFTTFELNEKKYPEGTHFALHLFIGKAAENSTIADDENDI
ncbi:MAG: hypothetical protein Q4D05_01800, partial [Acinetobacter sp.]|nr:hypothetical protein [Acinetobacter sp.]